MTKTLYALHQIHHTPEGADKTVIVDPKTIFEANDTVAEDAKPGTLSDADFFLAQDAARELTEAEAALYEKQTAAASSRAAKAAAPAKEEKPAKDDGKGASKAETKTEEKDPVG